MLKQRVHRIESFLQRRADRPIVWSAATCVKAVRRLLVEVAPVAGRVDCDPFPELEDEDYLLAFGPWLLANAERFPRWALEYACRVGGLFLRDASSWIDRGTPPPRHLQTAQDVVDLLEEQVEAVRANPAMEAAAKVRAIGYLAGIARQAIETGTLAARLEILERVLKQRTEGNER